MDFLADILLVSGALGAAFYCIVLSRRLAKFNDLEKGMGGAVAVLSAQVDDLTKALNEAQSGAAQDLSDLENLTTRAEEAGKKLELHLASLHDMEPAPAQDLAKHRPSTQPVFASSARKAQ